MTDAYSNGRYTTYVITLTTYEFSSVKFDFVLHLKSVIILAVTLTYIHGQFQLLSKSSRTRKVDPRCFSHQK